MKIAEKKNTSEITGATTVSTKTAINGPSEEKVVNIFGDVDIFCDVNIR